MVPTDKGLNEATLLAICDPTANRSTMWKDIVNTLWHMDVDSRTNLFKILY